MFIIIILRLAFFLEARFELQPVHYLCVVVVWGDRGRLVHQKLGRLRLRDGGGVARVRGRAREVQNVLADHAGLRVVVRPVESTVERLQDHAVVQRLAQVRPRHERLGGAEEARARDGQLARLEVRLEEALAVRRREDVRTGRRGVVRLGRRHAVSLVDAVDVVEVEIAWWWWCAAAGVWVRTRVHACMRARVCMVVRAVRVGVP